MTTEDKTTAGRAFVRSLNILLKFARLYGYDHVRTIEQAQATWADLRTADYCWARLAPSCSWTESPWRVHLRKSSLRNS
jgi:hypothetical protein